MHIKHALCAKKKKKSILAILLWCTLEKRTNTTFNATTTGDFQFHGSTKNLLDNRQKLD